MRRPPKRLADPPTVCGGQSRGPLTAGWPGCRRSKGDSAIFILGKGETVKRNMWMVATVWTSVAAICLITQRTGWAEETQRFGPGQFKMDQFLALERVIDANPVAPGVRGNNVPNIQRWNALLLQTSHTALRQQGPGSSPTGEVVSHKHQNLQSQTVRIE